MGSIGHNINSSRSSANFGENIWGGQSGPLQQMYQQALSLFGDQDMSGINENAGWGSDYAKGIAGGSLGGFGNQIGGGFRPDTALRNSLNESMRGPTSMGEMYNSIVGGQGNTFVDPMVDAMKSGMQTDFDRNYMPNLDQAAVAAGQSGSSRHGISEALGKSELARNMNNQEMGMRGQAYDKDLAMKMGIAQQADLGRGQAQDRAISLLDMQNQSQRGALGGAGGMQNLGMGGMNPLMMANQMPWQNLGALAGIIGAPTKLGSGSQRANSKGNSGQFSFLS